MRCPASAVSSLLPLMVLLSMLLHIHAENVRKCFVCTERNSPKCSGQLSPSDTELIKECPVGLGANGTAIGCQLIAMQTGELIHPKRDFIWRDCLYPRDLKIHGGDGGVTFIPNEDDPEGKKGGRAEFAPTGYIIWMNEWRRLLNIPLLPMCDLSRPIDHRSSFVELYYHPKPEFWNLSNGISIERALANTQVVHQVYFNFDKLSNKEVVPCPKPHLRSSSGVCDCSVWMLLGVGLIVIIGYF